MPVPERTAIDEGLADLHERMRTIAGLAERAIRTAVDAYEGTDGAQAAEVFTLDREIFELKQEITHRCVDLIARFAPVARDLRTITASLEITTDLDRIGRYARDIAAISHALTPEDHAAIGRLRRLASMGEYTIRMIDVAVEAFRARDAEPVRNIIQEDDAVDRLHDELFHEIVNRMADRSLSPEVGASLILVNRYFERLADHAVNIGDHVAYLVTGQRLTRIKRPDSGLRFPPGLGSTAGGEPGTPS